MKLNTVLVTSAIYMAFLGLGLVFAPSIASSGAIPADAAATLIGFVRVLGSTFIGIAVLNWASRNAAAATARDAVILSNIAGFGLATILGIWGLFSGALPVTGVFVVIHLLFTLGFVWAGRAGMSARES